MQETNDCAARRILRVSRRYEFVLTCCCRLYLYDVDDAARFDVRFDVCSPFSLTSLTFHFLLVLPTSSTRECTLLRAFVLSAK
jgi:hypothetical protein